MNFYYESRHQLTSASAERVAEIVCPVLRPQSVIDFGCGVGTWAKAFRDRGATRAVGVDKGVPRDHLVIDPTQYIDHDLREPIPVNMLFDLAVCVEVAEHLEPKYETHITDELARIATAIVFGAAIPGQGGSGHVNEKWQDAWAELFVERGFRIFDCIRPEIWVDEAIAPWYRQNIFLALRNPSLAACEAWADTECKTQSRLRMVHPAIWEANRAGPPVPPQGPLSTLLFRLGRKLTYVATKRRWAPKL